MNWLLKNTVNFYIYLGNLSRYKKCGHVDTWHNQRKGSKMAAKIAAKPPNTQIAVSAKQTHIKLKENWVSTSHLSS